MFTVTCGSRRMPAAFRRPARSCASSVGVRPPAGPPPRSGSMMSPRSLTRTPSWKRGASATVGSAAPTPCVAATRPAGGSRPPASSRSGMRISSRSSGPILYPPSVGAAARSATIAASRSWSRALIRSATRAAVVPAVLLSSSLPELLRIAQPRQQPRATRMVTVRVRVAMSRRSLGAMISGSAAHDTRIEVLREQLEQKLYPVEVRKALALVLQQAVPRQLLPRAPEQALTEPLVGQHTPEEAFHRLLRHRPLHAARERPCRSSTSREPAVYLSDKCQKVREKASTTRAADGRRRRRPVSQ